MLSFERDCYYQLKSVTIVKLVFNIISFQGLNMAEDYVEAMLEAPYKKGVS